jgi:hypothetical protein
MHDTSTPALPPGWTVQVDAIDAPAWHALLDRFADANIYQAWACEQARGGWLAAAGSVSHLRLLNNGEVCAAAQVRIVKLPLLRLGIAYVRWGPLWRLRGQATDPQVLSTMLSCLRHEYVLRRGLGLRLLPYMFQEDEQGELLVPLLAANGYTRLAGDTPQRTLLLPLGASLTELRAGLDQKWRNSLNHAERNGLVVEEGTSDELLRRFIAIHTQMRARKGFVATSDVHTCRDMQAGLPQRHRMRVLLASIQGQLAAGVVCSRLGDTGVFLHGATSDAGLRSNASYLLQWRALAWLKEGGAAVYNLHGINPLSNPGSWRFKAGLSGRHGLDLHYLGSHECHASAGGRMLLDGAQWLRRWQHERRTAPAQRPAAAGR